MTDDQDSPVVPQDELDAITIKRTESVRRRESIVGWSSIAANVLVPITIGVAASSLLFDSWREQRNTSQRQIELFYSANLGEAQSVLFALWDDVDLSVLRGPRPRPFIDAFVERTVATSDQDPRAVTGAIVNIASYFDRVEICIASGRCDEADIVSQLGQYGRDFHCIYFGQIENLRRDSLILSLGAGLEQFAQRSGGCDAQDEPKT